ncbi:MAG: response regulator [Magnetococcales bacterium]|nr:response regulator [Magnetococcales bacterium]
MTRQRRGILIVEDSLPTLKLLADLLQEEGHVVRPSTSGAVAMEALLAEPAELILLDVVMPVMDGFEFCRRVKAVESLSTIPVLFVSATMNSDEKVKGFAIGGVDFISKPYQRDELLARVRTHLELSRLQHRLESLVAQQTADLAATNRQLRQELQERMEVEERLKHLLGRFDAILSNTRDGFWIVDPHEGRILDVNQAYLEWMGYSREEVLAMRIADFEARENPDEIQRHLDTLIATGHDLFETRHRRKNGAFLDLEVSVTAVPLGDEHFVFGFFRDISQRIEMEKRLVHAHKMEAVGTLAGGIAHDFNNILAIILGNSELLHMRSACSDMELVNDIHRAALRGRDLVKQLLTFARHTHVQHAPFDPVPLLKEVLKFMRSTLPSSIRIRERITQERVVIVGDTSQFHQIVMNLCVNAGQAMGEEGGELQVALDCVSLSHQEAKALGVDAGRLGRLVVKDTGPGMDEEVRKRMFDPFFTTKEFGKGTGLGLAMVDSAVRNCAGAIQVESAPGKGTEITIWLPLGQQPDAGMKSAVVVPLFMGRGRILVVDDEATLVSTMSSLLKILGYTPEGYNDPLAALHCFQQAPEEFALVITDQIMPGMRGESLAAQILSIRPDLPVLLCTGYSEKLDEKRVYDMGCRGILYKPLTLADLSQAIDLALSGQTGSA